MGKKQHQQDKLYLTSTEWKQFYGGKKDNFTSLKDAKDFKRLPFYCCSLSFQACKHPYCTHEGIIFDLENIIPFLKKHGKNPVTGEKLDAKSLIKINFSKNAKEEYHCPVTYKVFNENTHIVAIRQTGNVYCNEAIEELNIKANYFKDLINDEPFTRKDIITIQDPKNLDKFNMSNFHFLKLKLKWEEDDTEARKNPNYYIRNANTETKYALEELSKTYTKTPVQQTEDVKADSVNAASYSQGRVAASLTSTVMEVVTKQEAAVIDENEIRWDRMRKKGKKGYVCLVTNMGRLNIELYCDQVPRVCENFLKHCANKYYKDTKFHRSIKHFMIQGGDPTGTGRGGESIWGKPFEDEFKPNLSHTGRGILSMANTGPDTNKSQFFITFRSCTHLDNKHSVFGKIVGGLDVLSKLESVPTDKQDTPKEPIIIEDTLVFIDPYADVDEEIKAEREIEKQKLEKKNEKPTDIKTKKPNLDNLKVQRSGVGKYLSNTIFESNKRSKIVEETDVETEEKLKKQKKEGKSTYSFGEFSGW